MEGGDEEGSKRVKREKGTGSFYLIDMKIVVFAKDGLDAKNTKFLTDISESISKPAHISEYEINETSLLRAKSLGYTSDKVLAFLRDHSKNTISTELKQ